MLLVCKTVAHQCMQVMKDALAFPENSFSEIIGEKWFFQDIWINNRMPACCFQYIIYISFIGWIKEMIHKGSLRTLTIVVLRHQGAQHFQPCLFLQISKLCFSSCNIFLAIRSIKLLYKVLVISNPFQV